MLNIIRLLTNKKIKKQYRNIEQVEFDYINKNRDSIMIDVRSKQEYLENHIAGSMNIPLNKIRNEIETKVPNKNKEVIVYCQTGIRSMKAASILESLGYLNIKNLEGGLNSK